MMFDKEIDVAKIMSQIKEQSSTAECDDGTSNPKDSIFAENFQKNRYLIEDYSKIIEERKIVGVKIPQFTRFNKALRKPLQFITKVVFKLAHPITRDQNIVNSHMQLSLKKMAELIEVLEKARIQDINTIRIMQQKIDLLEEKSLLNI